MNNKKLETIIKTAILAVILQVIFMIAGIIITLSLGAPPETAVGYFSLFSENHFFGLLADDSYNLVLIFMYLFSITALFILLKKHRFALSLYAFAFVAISIIICITSHSGFSMMHLSKQYVSASDPNVKSRLLAAGEAIIAQNMWNSTSGFFSGILMQGGCLLITLAMIGSKKFSKITIAAGLLCNGFDLLNHLIHYSLPQIAVILLYIASPFYMLWYLMLIIDFKKILNAFRKKEIEV